MDPGYVQTIRKPKRKRGELYALIDSVRIQLRSDVPLGAYSGALIFNGRCLAATTPAA